MEKPTAFVMTLLLTASFAWTQAASPTPISKVALNPQPLPPGAGKAANAADQTAVNPQPRPAAAIIVRKAGERQQGYELNPQPLRPGTKVELNPQPLPPKVNSNAVSRVALNPQPLPPGQKVELNPQPFPPGPNDKPATIRSKGDLNPGTKVGFNPQPDPPAVQKHVNASTTKLF